MPYATTVFTLLHNNQEIPVEHYCHKFEGTEDNRITFTYKGINSTFSFNSRDDTAESLAKKMCIAIDHGGINSRAKFERLYRNEIWIKYRYIVLDGKVYNHAEIIPNAKKRHIYELQFKNGKTVRNISNSRYLDGDDDRIIRSVKLSLRSIEYRAKEWHEKTGSLPKDEYFDKEHTEELREIHKFYDEIGIGE